MSDITSSSASAPRRSSLLVQDERTKRRNASEARFRFVGLIAVAIGVLALVGLLTSILANGLSSFQQTYAEVEVYLDPAKLDKSGDRNLEKIAKVSTFGYAPLIQVAMETASAKAGVDVSALSSKDLVAMISKEAPATLRNYVLANPEMIGETVTFSLLVNGRIDGYFKGRVTMASAALDRNISP